MGERAVGADWTAAERGSRRLELWDADPALGRVVLSVEQIAERVAELGEAITADYAGRPPLLVGVLKGAFIFLADLAREIQLPLELDFMAVSSYGTATKTSGVVRILKDLDIDLTGRHVLIVEDILDSGLTLSYLRNSLLARGPESLAVCSLLVKRSTAPTPESRGRLRRLRHRARVRRRLRPRRRRALPQPSRHPRLQRRRAGVSRPAPAPVCPQTAS